MLQRHECLPCLAASKVIVEVLVEVLLVAFEGCLAPLLVMASSLRLPFVVRLFVRLRASNIAKVTAERPTVSS